MKAKYIATLVGGGLLLLIASACEQAKPSGAADTSGPAAAAKTSQAGDQAAGTKHDPPIQKADVAAGHWYCDMGTVHYSRGAKGDGKCPRCQMDLEQK